MGSTQLGDWPSLGPPGKEDFPGVRSRRTIIEEDVSDRRRPGLVRLHGRPVGVAPAALLLRELPGNCR